MEGRRGRPGRSSLWLWLTRSVTGQPRSVYQGVSLTHACGTMPGCSGELVGGFGRVEGLEREANEPGRHHQMAPPHPLLASYPPESSHAQVSAVDPGSYASVRQELVLGTRPVT